jgi:hypothetical protein
MFPEEVMAKIVAIFLETVVRQKLFSGGILSPDKFAYLKSA